EGRSVAMDEDAGRVVLVVGVAADVRTTIDDEDALVEDGRDAFGDDAAGEPRADDDPVERHSILPREAVVVAPDAALRDEVVDARDSERSDGPERALAAVTGGVTILTGVRTG